MYWNWLAFYTETSWLNTLEYYCFPRTPSDSLTDKTWKIMRISTVTLTWKMTVWKCIQRAWWTPDYNFEATDLATVSAFSYS